MNSRRAAAAVCCALLALLAAGCGGEARTERTLYVAVPMDGPLAQRGRDMAHAAALRIQQAGGDTDGTQLKLKVIDSTDKLDMSAAAADPKAVAFVGGLSITAVRSVAAVDAKSGLLQIALTPAPRLSASANARLANVIWQLPSAPGQGDALAQYIAALGQTKIGFFNDGTAFAQAVQGGFVAGIKRAGITQIKLGPDAGNVPVAGAGSSKGFVEADDPANPTPPSPHTIVTAGMTADAYPPAGERFYKKFAATYGHQPDRFAIYAFEATGLVVDAIGRLEDEKKSITRSSVTAEAFGIKNRFGPVGHYDVLPSGRTSLYIFQARGGDAPTGPASLIEALR